MGAISVAVLGMTPVYADEVEVSERMVAQYAPEAIPNSGVDETSSGFRAEVGETRIDVNSADTAVEVSDHSGSIKLEALPGLSVDNAIVTNDGSVVYEVEDGTRLLTQPLKDAAVRMSVSIDRPDQPDEYIFDVIPEGGRGEVVEGVVLIFDASDEFVGALEEPWAYDSAGISVPTHYSLRNGVVVQTVEHSVDNRYPVIADPLFRRGVIKIVEREVWSSKGGYEMSLRVTTAARIMWAQPKNWATIYSRGLADLREHYPRSMGKATMAQQWQCHVFGLVGTFKIDLEGWRASKPNWAKTEIRKALNEAVKKKDPRAVSRACNW